MKVLILGGSGFLGKNFAEEFSSQGHQVFSFDLAHNSINKNITYIDGDFFHYDFTDLIKQCDCVIHAICTISTNNCDQTYMRGYSLDFLRGVEIFEMCSKLGKKIIFLSSGGTVYGNTNNIPIKEEEPTRPISHYGVLKASLENVARVFNKDYGKNILCVRISNPYGPGQDYTKGIGFIDAAIRKSLNKETLTIYGDGQIVRDYIYVNDVAKIIVSLASNEFKYDVLNIGSGIGTSQNEIVKILSDLGYKLDVNYISKRNYDVLKSELDISKLKTIYKDNLVDLKKGIKLYIDYLIKNK